MKKVEATIQQHKLAEVKDALQEKGVEGLTVTGGHYVGGETRTMTYRGVTSTVDAMPWMHALELSRVACGPTPERSGSPRSQPSGSSPASTRSNSAASSGCAAR